MPLPKNRLASIFNRFIKDKKLTGRVDSDQLGAELTVLVRGKAIHVRYNFDQEEDNYEFGAALHKVNPSTRERTTLLTMTSQPVRGITERIIANKFVILGSRDGLKELSDESIFRRYMDDVARIAYYCNQTSHLLDEVS